MDDHDRRSSVVNMPGILEAYKKECEAREECGGSKE